MVIYTLYNCERCKREGKGMGFDMPPGWQRLPQGGELCPKCLIPKKEK